MGSLFPYAYDPTEAGNISTYAPVAATAAGMYGIPQNLFMAQIYQESGFNPSATSSTSSATGIAQFIKSTAQEFGLDPTDPIASLFAAAKYDRQLYDRTGSWSEVMQRYGTGTSAPNIQNALSQLGNSQAGSTWQDTMDALGGGSMTSSIGDVPFTSSGDTANSTLGAVGKRLDQLGNSFAGWFTRGTLVATGVVFLAGALYIYGSEAGYIGGRK
jgi:hypothetical protein